MEEFRDFEQTGPLFEVEIQVFERLLPSLLETDFGRWALIEGEEFHGAFDTENDAIQTGYTNCGNVPFLVRQILEHQPVEFYNFAKAA